MNQDDQIEASLDLEWSGAVARGATVIYAYLLTTCSNRSQYVIDQNLAPVVSVSYGGCELTSAASFRGLARQANAEGVTWMNAAGDSGAAGCDSGGEAAATQGPAAMFPADIPEVTAVGGTEFNGGVRNVLERAEPDQFRIWLFRIFPKKHGTILHWAKHWPPEEGGRAWFTQSRGGRPGREFRTIMPATYPTSL